MPISLFEEDKNVKTPQQIRDAHKQDVENKKVLYGSGYGWTKEGYEKRLEAFRNGNLVITTKDPGEINLLLAEGKPEEELTDDERILLCAGCYPVTKIKMTQDELNGKTTILSLSWHKLTDFRNIEDVKKYHPEIYNQWKDVEEKSKNMWEEI